MVWLIRALDDNFVDMNCFSPLCLIMLLVPQNLLRQSYEIFLA